MRVRLIFAAAFAAALVVCMAEATPLPDNSGISHAASLPSQTLDAAIIEDIAFVGLRRVAPQAVAAQLHTRVGDPFDRWRLDDDVHGLGRLGWFASVQVEQENPEENIGQAGENSRRTRLIFRLEEHLLLVGVTYSGSRLLSRQQIEKLLMERKVAINPGAPENPVSQYQAASAIRGALAMLGHPEARVQMRREESTSGTVRVRFEIDDGPRITLGRILFEGEPGVPQKILRRQMKRLRPDAWFAGLRGTNVYTAEGFAEDRERLLTYYHNHGYPLARVGTATDSTAEGASRSWLLWPRLRHQARVNVTVPVQARGFYRIELVNVSARLKKDAIAAHAKLPMTPAQGRPGHPYSAQVIDTFRRDWQARLQPKSVHQRDDRPAYVNVEAIRTLDTLSHHVRIQLEESVTPPYIVRRLEFLGIHRFPDRYFRRRIALREGAPLDDRALEAGLARLARTTYFKPLKKEDVRVMTNDVTHTADVSIRIEELGQQRVSLTGGRGQFGSTLGIVYTVFNFLHGEELLSSHIEGGPESLQLAMGLAKEGLLGSRGSLALAVFNSFLRPRFSGSPKGPFFQQNTEGVDATWSYTPTPADSLLVSYDLSHTKTQSSPIPVAGVTGLTVTDAPTETSSHAAGLGWTHDTGAERIVLADSVSGGWLGGSENLVRSKVEYGRLWRDQLFDSRNVWAIRTTLRGVGSYSGAAPFSSRFFPGDDFVRGLSAGALGPKGVTSSVSPTGATKYSATPAGTDLTGAGNVEYRKRLADNTEATVFFDLGSGMLLPNWLGPSRPALINSTNRVVHASTGMQVQWTVPGIGLPLRGYYALNILRLDRWLPMPDGSVFRARDRLAGFGWGLAPMF
jgi:outer membrane protein assembly factor BamA